MKSPIIIKNQLKKLGNSLCLIDGDWTSAPYFAYVYPLWRRKTSAFEREFTEVGIELKEYYLYIGPYDHDITALSDDAQLHYGDDKFIFMRRDCVKCGDEKIYYTGILRKLKEGEYVEY